MTWTSPRYPSMPQNKPLTVADVLGSPLFGPAVMGAVNNPSLRSSLVGKSVPWSAVDLPLVTALPQNPDDRAEVNYLIDSTNETIVRMVYRKATGNWVQVGAAPILTALPTTTTEGLQIVYDTGTAGVRWHLVYDSSGGTTYPWLFIGGPPLTAAVETDQSTTSTSFVALATAGPSITVPLAGDYIVRVSGNTYSSSGTGSNLHSYSKGATAASTAWGADQHANGTNQAQQYAAEDVQTGLAASTALVSKYANSAAATGQWRRRRMSVLPVMVG